MPPRTDDPLTGGLRLPLLTVVVAVLAGVASAGPLFDRLDASLDPAPSTESERTEAELVAATGVDGSLVALLEAPEVDLSTLPGRVEALPGVGDAELVPSSVEPEAVVMVATVAAELDDDGRERLVAEFVEVVEGTAAETTVGGSLALDQELADTAESDLLRADALAVPVILLLFGLLLGGVRVALVPLAIVVVVLAGSLPILLALSAVTTVSVFAVNVVTLFGVGLAVDYGLLVVSRFREELAGGAGVETGLAVTRATAGRAVVYSGLTVATSLAALLVFEEPVLRSLAYGGMAATLLSVVAAHWLLQPLLRRSAHRLRPAQAVDPDRGRIAALARRIQERPALVAAGTVAVLLAAATPLGSINFEGLDARSLPGGSPTRDLVERLAESHPDLPLAPVQVLVDAPIDADSAVELVEAIESAPGAGALSATPLGDRTLIAVAPPGAATDAAALELVRDLRSIESDADVGVTGEAAEEVDLLDSIADRLPAAMVLLVALTLGLLVTFTRAPVVAAKAIVINALSIAAAFGLLVLLVQEGGLAGPLGFDATGGLSVVILLVTFAFAFGLSMDYEVFLLARIREHHERNGDNSLAVVRGLQQSGRVVTQAAGLIVLVFAGFALGDLLLVQQLGVGLALAVVVDATIVRLVLLPALMALLGELNWWNPFGTGSRA